MKMLRASELAKHRLALAARRLGTKNPVETIGGFIDRSFELPVGDPRYYRNSLMPGSMPIEHSFSEMSTRALRLDFEPLGPQATPAGRRQEASREARRLVNGAFGRDALAWFDEYSEPFRGAHTRGDARFGAWFGAAYDDRGLSESKVYYELQPDQLSELPPNLQHAARIAMSHLPGLVPLFTSIACNRSHGAQRIYLHHRGDLRLLDLAPMMRQLGVGHQLPALLSAIGLILGGRFILADGSVIIGLRDTLRGIEMKLDILLPAVPDPPQRLDRLIDMHLSQRPDNQRAFNSWLRAMTPDEYGTPGDVNVVSVRVNPTMGSRFTVYFKPVGYDRPPQSTRPGEVTTAPAVA